MLPAAPPVEEARGHPRLARRLLQRLHGGCCSSHPSQVSSPVFASLAPTEAEVAPQEAKSSQSQHAGKRSASAPRPSGCATTPPPTVSTRTPSVGSRTQRQVGPAQGPLSWWRRRGQVDHFHSTRATEEVVDATKRPNQLSGSVVLYSGNDSEPGDPKPATAERTEDDILRTSRLAQAVECVDHLHCCGASDVELSLDMWPLSGSIPGIDAWKATVLTASEQVQVVLPAPAAVGVPTGRELCGTSGANSCGRVAAGDLGILAAYLAFTEVAAKRVEARASSARQHASRPQHA